MKYFFTPLVLFLFFQISFGQIVINELDSDSPGVDLEEFIELKTDEPFASLDDYVLVFFNGSAAGQNWSYLTIDLSGYASDVNGVFLIGSTNVSPVPHLLIAPNIIQNGEDAVGIYYGNASDFPYGTLATTDNLIDALVYGTNDPISYDLLQLLGQTEQIDEDLNNNKDHESIQRNPDGTYFVGTPSPGQNNDGSGIILNGIDVYFADDQYIEGETIVIEFNTDEPVEEDLTFSFTLNNGTFDENDYTGETTVTIPQGENYAFTNIYLIEDGIDEGDEILRFQFDEIPDEYFRVRDYLEIRIVDLDFQVADFGTPLNPTYGLVESTQPPGYYDSLDGLAGDDLRQAIQDIIANPNEVRAHSYEDVIQILKEADQNPENSHEVWLVYLEKGRAKIDYQTTSASIGKWNREHTWPRSRGGFYARSGDEIAGGKDVYWVTNADSIRHGYSDAHAIRAADGPENSSRGNKNYGPQEYDGPSGTEGSFWGDVARGVLFLDIRYNGLEVVNGYPVSGVVGELGDLQSLLMWHEFDPPDDFEMNRNNIVYSWQINRNPFIDYPELVSYIWGSNVGTTWHQPDMSVAKTTTDRLNIYPNPAGNHLYIHGISGENLYAEIYSLDGKRVFSEKVKGYQMEFNLDSGLYILKVTQGKKTYTERIIIR